jgi:hypothetical protein
VDTPQYYPPTAQYAQPPQYQAPGAGIGTGDDIVNSIFDRL